MNMKIYLTRYNHGKARIMSLDAVDKGKRWECDKETACMEMGEMLFFIPEFVSKTDEEAFLSIEEAVESLAGKVARDIEGAQTVVQGLYGQLTDLSDCQQAKHVVQLSNAQ